MNKWLETNMLFVVIKDVMLNSDMKLEKSWLI